MGPPSYERLSIAVNRLQAIRRARAGVRFVKLVVNDDSFVHFILHIAYYRVSRASRTPR